MPPNTSTTTLIFLDWTFWSFIVSAIALLISLFPYLKGKFLPKRLEIEVHKRIQITHFLGNPNVKLHIGVVNSGASDLRIRGMQLDIEFGGKPLTSLPVQEYSEQPSVQARNLFVPYTLMPGKDRSCYVTFYMPFDRETEKHVKTLMSVLQSDIFGKLQEKKEKDDQGIFAEEQNVAPLIMLFKSQYIWRPGEYIFKLSVHATPGSASYVKKYRFMLYESDTAKLESYVKEYNTGVHVFYQKQVSDEVWVDITEHVG